MRLVGRSLRRGTGGWSATRERAMKATSCWADNAISMVSPLFVSPRPGNAGTFSCALRSIRESMGSPSLVSMRCGIRSRMAGRTTDHRVAVSTRWTRAAKPSAAIRPSFSMRSSWSPCSTCQPSTMRKVCHGSGWSINPHTSSMMRAIFSVSCWWATPATWGKSDNDSRLLPDRSRI